MEQEHDNTKRKNWKQLTEKQRYQIEALHKAGIKNGEIAKQIGCSRRTIERELKRGLVEQLVPLKSPNRQRGDREVQLVYLADAAQRKHEENNEKKGRKLKIGSDHELAEFIEDAIINKHWSPDAVIGYIRENKLPFKTSICTKTLYNYIDQGIFIHLTNKDLLYKRDPVKRGYHRVRKVALNNRDGKSIEERPPEIDLREEKGHWELDTVVGRKGTQPVVVTLVERKTRKSIYILTKNKSQKEILRSIRKAQKRVGGDFTQVFLTITTDNGSEFLDAEGIKAATGCNEVYYTHPFSSWEKGSNEKGNSMLRRFFPKGTDFSEVTEEELQKVEDWVNSYPRKILGYRSANEAYYEQ